MKQLSLFSQSKALARAGSEGTLYVKGSDLYYGNTSGTEVQLTSAGSIYGGAATVVYALPTAGAAYRGRFYLLNVSGQGDRLNICLLKADGVSYGWYEITRAV